MTRLTILLLTDLFPPVRGGLERHVDELATFLAEAGHEVHVATCTQHPVASSAAVHTHPVRTSASRVVRHADPNRPYHPPAADPEARAQLRRLVQDIRPDIVHGHSWIAHSLPRDMTAPVVLTAHDYGLICPRRTLYDRDDEQCSGPRGPGSSPWGLGCVGCAAEQYGWPKATLGAAATRLSRNHLTADHIIAVSHAVADALRPWVSPPLSVMHNWVANPDGTPSTGRPDAVPDGDFVLYAGDRGAHKGVDTLLDAWTGSGAPPGELFLATTRPFDRALPPRVRNGTLGFHEMPRAWRAARVAVVPSLWPEPCPLVALEALSAGTPVVASRVGGLPELIRDGEDGFLVEPGDVHGLRASVTKLLDDPGLRDEMGARARERAATTFAPSVVIPKVESLYRELIARGRR